MKKNRKDVCSAYDGGTGHHIEPENVPLLESQLAETMLAEIKAKFPLGSTFSADTVSKELSMLVRREDFVKSFDPGITHYLHLKDVPALHTLGYQNKLHQVIAGYVVWITRNGDRWHLNFL